MLDLSRVLVELFSHFWSSVPSRSSHTFLELILAVIVSHGHVSDALLSGICAKHWTNYYKWLRQGSWSHLAVSRACFKLLLSQLPGDWVTLVIDDTTVYRKTKKAPRVGILHEHGTKANRPTYVNGQCLVTLACVVRNRFAKVVAFPIQHFVSRRTGNRNKLIAAKVLYRSVARIITGKKVRVLVDAWYMKARLVLYLVQEGAEVIGQVRKDVALYEEPGPQPVGKRGRKPKRGQRVYLSEVETKHFKKQRMLLYGKEVIVHYRSADLLARFLLDRKVRVVWTKIEDPETKEISTTRVLICTSLERTPLEIIDFYSQRWGIEPMFNAMKNQWGIAKAWQQQSQTLSRWLTVLSAAYFVPAYLLAFHPDLAGQIAHKAPWRKEEEISVATVAAGLRLIIRGLGLAERVRQNEEIKRAELMRIRWLEKKLAA